MLGFTSQMKVKLAITQLFLIVGVASSLSRAPELLHEIILAESVSQNSLRLSEMQ